MKMKARKKFEALMYPQLTGNYSTILLLKEIIKAHLK